MAQGRQLSLKVVKTHFQGHSLIGGRPGVQPTAVWLHRWQKLAADTIFRGWVKHYFLGTWTVSIEEGNFFKGHHLPHVHCLSCPLSHLLSLPDPWGHRVCDPCFQNCLLFGTQCCCLLGILFPSVPMSSRVLARNDFCDFSKNLVLHKQKKQSLLPLTMRAQFFWVIHSWIIHLLLIYVPMSHHSYEETEVHFILSKSER